MTIDYKALGAKIKEYRKKENITQEQLAEMADISLSHMSNIETASASVSLPALKLIADALDVTLDELLIDSYSKKQKEYLYSRKLECILEQCETVEQEIIVNTASALADNLSKIIRGRFKKVLDHLIKTFLLLCYYYRTSWIKDSRVSTAYFSILQ